ncbi:MAG: serine hydrolase [Actinomycetota bacterium]|nr:serine hydrolase [Actinomycetota bacterium]
MQLQVESSPAKLGFDESRLARIGEYFQAFVDDRRLPGWLVHVAREGESAYLASSGFRDIEAGLPVENDTVFRIYSMTKPITSVAAMVLYERGALRLNDPVSDYIPAFANARVFSGGSSESPVTVGLTEPVRIWHLFTHTAGLTYGFMYAHPTDAIYRKRGFEWGQPPGMDLAGSCENWAAMPLAFQPGSSWSYSVATDVLGGVVEVASGMSLDQFFRTEIFEPLGMTDTAFWADEQRHGRLAALYIPSPEDRKAMRFDAFGKASMTRPSTLSGGGGLVSTASDYFRFITMLLNKGELEGTRILGRKTVELMATNHLPGNQDIESFGRPVFAESSERGIGFGLGFSVVIDKAAAKTSQSQGTFGWGGAASTTFWVDPVEGITVEFFTQLLPSSTYVIADRLAPLVYQAML